MFTEEELERRKKLNEQGYWEVPDGIDTTNFDFNWKPDPYERPYIHQFGTQWQKTGGPKFIIPENEGIKYQNFQHVIKLPNSNNRCWRPLVPNATIDYSWHPDETDPPYIYVFGNQWYDYSIMPTFQYRVKGASEKKFIDNVSATLLPNLEKWEVPDDLSEDFDYSWIPHPYEPPMIWQFGTQWQKTGGPKYICDNALGVKQTDIQTATKKINKEKKNWRPLKSNIDFDWSWHPNEDEPPYIYVFGNQWYDAEIMPTVMYKVKGATEKKYINDIKATLLENKENWEIPPYIDDSNFDYSWCPNPFEPKMNWQFGTQWQKTGGPKYKEKDALGTKFVDFQKVKKLPIQDNRYYRVLKSNIEFDFSWHPDETEPPYIYIFGNQWYDAEIMPTVLYRVKGAIEKKYVNDIKVTLLPVKDVWEIPNDISDNFDYSWCPNPKEPLMNWQFGTQWQKTGGPKYINDTATKTKYTDVQKAVKLSNLKNWRIIELIEQDKFDFSWHPDETDGNFNYIFGNQYHSPENMPSIMYKNKNATTVKYSRELRASLSVAKMNYTDSIFNVAFENKLDTKYTYIGNIDLDLTEVITDDNIPHIHLVDNVAAVVPNNFKSHVYDKLQDFPYIKYHNLGYKNMPLDIVFLTNGEKGSEENYEHLLKITKKYTNRLIVVKDIKGRVKSQHEAAKQAKSPWYFLVNAKLKVNDNFDFNWQPNRMKKSKHYIFTATNNVNGLEYGHMAIVANNKKLTLETLGTELDFTLEKEHEVVNVNSGIGIFNTSEWDTWRTSFREVLKLKHFYELSKDTETEYRLNTWINSANGAYKDFCTRGATDALNYFDLVKGDFTKLKLSYDWDWLLEFYKNKYE